MAPAPKTLRPVRLFPVTDSKRQPGIGSLGDDAPNFELASIEQLFDREWGADVHFACYSVIGPDEEGPTSDPFPRLRKTALDSIEKAGGMVVLGALTFDFDLQNQTDLPSGTPRDDEGKPVWTTELLEAFIEGVKECDKILDARRIAKPIVYTTTHGARFVHLLTKSVQCEEGEDLLRGLHATYRDMGMVMDPLFDWTRLFRAPKVVRDGVRTWERRWFWIRWTTDLTDPDAIEPISKQQEYADRYAAIKPVRSTKPTPEQAYERLFEIGSQGRERKTMMHREAEKILKGTDAYAPIFQHAPLAEQGERDQTLLRLVGQATTFLLDSRCGLIFLPEDIYALFLHSVEQLDPDAGTPDWTESLWSKVKTCYERESAKQAAKAEEEAESKERAKTRAERLLMLMKQTCNLPDLHCGDEVTEQTALRRLLLIREPGGRYRAFNEDGYTHLAAAQSGLHYLIEKGAKIEEQIELHKTNSKDQIVKRPENEIAREAAEVVEVQGAAGITHSHIIGTEWDRLVLRLQLFRRNPLLVPEYDPEVDEWLTRLTPHPKILKRWIAYALDFENGPISALSLAGSPGAGKGMLAQGLVETLEFPARATGASLTSDFNSELLRTPWLVVDEGVPHGSHNITDRFRQLSAGEPVRIEEKFKSPVEVRNPMRVVFMANNLQIIAQLATQRVNEENDQLALAQRITHLEVTEEPADYLRAMGGLEHTRGWVQGAAGQDSTFRLARHLLWLYEHREDTGPPDKRLLVEGPLDNEVIQSLRYAGVEAQAICRAILHLLEHPHTPRLRSGVSIQGGRLRVNSGAIEAVNEQTSSLPLNTQKIGRVMRNLASAGFPEAKKDLLETLDGQKSRQTWWDVDVSLLWRYAEESGHKREALRKLVIAQFNKDPES